MCINAINYHLFINLQLMFICFIPKTICIIIFVLYANAMKIIYQLNLFWKQKLKWNVYY